MNRRGLRSASLLCVLTLAACGAAEAPVPTPAVASGEESIIAGKILADNLVEIAATVEEIDQDTRMVTLRGSDGETVSFRAGDSVRNLAQVKKGDLVTASYYESIAVRLRKPG